MYLKKCFSVARNFATNGSRVCSVAALGVSLLFSQSTGAGLIETVEAPGRQTSPASNTTTVNFNSATLGYHFSETFQVTPSLSVTYTGDQFIKAADQYGGAVNPSTGKDTNYFAVQSGNVTMTLSATQAYFGIWISAADKYNQIAFYNGNTEVGSLTGTGAFLSALPSTYNGNPTPDFKGYDAGEKFVFVNFYAQKAADEFNKIVLTNTPGSGTTFESDNHTFSTELQAPSSVPEPSSFALLGLGVCVLAANVYRRGRKTRN
jgi:hypothetical protein